MQQEQDKNLGKMAPHVSHMSKRPPRLANMVGTPDQPHMHKDQRPEEDEISEWGDWISSEGQNTDDLHVPPQMKKKGFAYQWISKSCLGSEDTIVKRRLAKFFKSGWKPVPGIRGKGYFYFEGEEAPETIVIGACMLVEKPQHIADHARKQNADAAKSQLRDKMLEVGMAAPSNVRHKLVNTHTDGGVGVQTRAPGASGVPD